MADDDDDRPTALRSLDPARNFTITTDERVRALAVGVPAYAARKRRIEDLEKAMVKKLVAFHDALLEKGRTPEEALRETTVRARQQDHTKINTLIEKHNRYYPIEANLPIDTESGGYLVFGRRWMPESPWTEARLSEVVENRIAARSR